MKCLVLFKLDVNGEIQGLEYYIMIIEVVFISYPLENARSTLSLKHNSSLCLFKPLSYVENFFTAKL